MHDHAHGEEWFNGGVAYANVLNMAPEAINEKLEPMRQGRKNTVQRRTYSAEIVSKCNIFNCYKVLNISTSLQSLSSIWHFQVLKL